MSFLRNSGSIKVSKEDYDNLKYKLKIASELLTEYQIKVERLEHQNAFLNKKLKLYKNFNNSPLNVSNSVSLNKNNYKLEILNKLKNQNYANLKIAIKSPHPNANEVYGDRYFANSLKNELEERGFQVIVHSLENWYSNDFNEDITIVLRGLKEYKVDNSKINIMWNISHPEDVSIEEYNSYDLVFIASFKYASVINKKTKTTVKPLLQCTDTNIFYPNKDKNLKEDILFVGNSRYVFRKIIQDISKSNHNFSVYGPNWEEFINKDFIKGNFIQNNELNKYYSSCKILLNDHWNDMISNDFPSNRLFDALACGTFIISDDIQSIHTLFKDTIITYSDSKDLNEKLNYYLEHEDKRIELANKGRELVINNHTFKNRVDSILEVLNKMNLVENSNLLSDFSSINIKHYYDFNEDKSKYNIGLFVKGSNNEYPASVYIRLLSVFNLINNENNEFIPYIISEDLIQDVKKDIYNDNFFMDMIVIQRDVLEDDFARLLINECKSKDIKIIYEIDDDLLSIDKSHPQYNHYIKKVDTIKFIIENSDSVVVSTSKLRDKISYLNNNIFIIPNTLPIFWDNYVKQPIKSKDIKIGYIGTVVHTNDLILLKDVISNVKNYFAKKNQNVIFEVIGGTNEELPWINNISIPEGTHLYPRFVNWIKETVDWTIAVSPLEKSFINESKSELKYIEYTELGIPSVFTDFGPYHEHIKHNYNGLVVKDNNIDDWTENIINLIENSNLHNKIIDNAKSDIQEKYNVDKALRLWLNILKFNSSKINKFNDNQVNIVLSNFDKVVSIIIPIYNAYEETKLCIESIINNTNIPYELILVDDNSSDERLFNLYETLEKNNNHIKIIKNKENKGFVKNVNIGIQYSNNDVVLLNSDTLVTPKWLLKLETTAYLRDNIATVTPVSNNAGAFSVPNFAIENEIPSNLGLDGISNIVEKCSNRVFMEVPTGNGFCMYIKREAINSVGLFDEENFGKGYGEENDFCMRVLNKGWVNVMDDTTYIYHKKGTSFSEKREKLIKEHRKILDDKHPDYTKKIREFTSSSIFENIRNNIQKGINEFDSNKFNKKRILYVLHSFTGGTPKTNEDLMNYVENDYDCFMLVSNRTKFTLYNFLNGTYQIINEWNVNTLWKSENYYVDEYNKVYFEVLINYSIDLVHIRHLVHHSFDLPKLCNQLGIPIILSFHDFYFICPSVNLIEKGGYYCAGKCDSSRECIIPPNFTNIPNMKSYISTWRKHVSEMLDNVNHFITTSEIVKDMYIDTYPLINYNNFSVIEHGRDFDKISEDIFEIPSSDKPIKILFIGNMNVAKGSNVIKNLYNYDVDSKLEFHFLGKVTDDLKDIGINHGVYERDNLKDKIKEIKPSFIGIFSIWSETYCHTLSEAWACGIPVLSTQIGVLEDRVNQNGGGWFIDHENPQKTFDLILSIANNKEEYLNKQNEAKNVKFKSIKEMSDDYLDIYNDLVF